LFKEYAIDLIEEIQKQNAVSVSVRYDIGLAGIGVGFEYFLQNDFIEAEDDFFEDFDSRMYRTVMYEPYPDLSLEGGLTGLGRYFIYRLRGNGYRDRKLHKALTHIAFEISKKIRKKKVSENEQPDVYRFFYDLTSISKYAEKYSNLLQLCKEWACINKPNTQKIFPYMNNLQRLYTCQNYFKIDLTKEIGLEWKTWEESDSNNTLTNTGLLNGWTTEGLFYLTFFKNLCNSWIKLL
jgi:hypothetical protein